MLKDKDKKKYGTLVKKGLRSDFLDKMRGMGAESIEKENRARRRKK